MKSYLRCPTCKSIIDNSWSKYSRIDIPCPSCGKVNETRVVWPNVSVFKFFEVIQSLNLDNHDQRRIAIIFLCTALEVLIEEAIWDLLEFHTDSRELAELTIENNSGLKRMKRLYNKLSKRTIGELLDNPEEKQFLDDWAALSKVRNKIVHGIYYAELEDETNIITRTRDICFQIFIKINDDIMKQEGC